MKETLREWDKRDKTLRSALDTEKLQQERLQDELQDEVLRAGKVDAILGGD